MEDLDPTHVHQDAGDVDGVEDLLDPQLWNCNWAEWWACCCIMLAKDASKPSSISLYTPTPSLCCCFSSLASCFSLDYIFSLGLIAAATLSLSLSLCKNQSGRERKKKICLTTQIKALAPMKKKDSSSSSSSPWVLSAELQNLSTNQTWNNNICSNHGM